MPEIGYGTPFEQDAITKLQIPVQAFEKVTVTVPTILQPVYYDLADATYGGNFQPYLYYSPKKQGLIIGASLEMRISHAGGVCFLDSPGDWWVYNPNTVYRFELLVIPAKHEAVAQYYNAPGQANQLRQSNNQSASNQDVTYTVGQSAVILLANWYRAAVMIQNVAAAGGTQLRVHAGTSNAAANRGIRVLTSGSVSYDGGTIPRERFTIWAELGTCAVNLHQMVVS